MGSFLMHLLFPERNSHTYHEVADVAAAFQVAEAELYQLLLKTKACGNCDVKQVASDFFKHLPQSMKRCSPMRKPS